MHSQDGMLVSTAPRRKSAHGAVPRFCFGLTILFSFAVTWMVTAANSCAGQPENGDGSLVIIGGALRYDQNDVWKEIVELAGGPGVKIAVFPTASSDPFLNGSRTVDALKANGAEAFLVPLWVTRPDVDYRKLVSDPALVEQIKNVNGVYFLGGSQERITQALGSSAGDRTPLLNAIWDVYHRGGVIAGSSAGAAVMSHVMYCHSPSVLKTMENGVSVGNELGPGLGFLDSRWFVEQHCLVRGRFGRSLVAMHTVGLRYGIGIDENTAVVVRRGHEMSVIGYRGAIVMDLSQASVDPEVKSFNLKNARITYLDHGDSFNLDDMSITPSQEKQDEGAIDPASPEFKPSRDDALVVTDILGNNALVELLGRLIENKRPEAIGLAFDASAAREGTTGGFEFRFYREPDSRGWYPPANGTGTSTVSNIHLDIRPIEITGPLYR